jgi:hypothetical protein
MGRAIELVDDILGRTPGEDDMTYSVILGAIERLPSGPGSWRADAIRRHAEKIERTIVDAANVGMQQAFSAFAALGRFLSSEDPAMFQRIIGRLPEPTPESLATDGERFSWAEICFEAARLGGGDVGKLRGKALALYEAEVRPHRFHLQRRAELLIEMGRSAEGEVLLRGRDDLETSEWIQRLMARARLAQNDPVGALTWINQALSRLKAEHFRSEFLELRYDIRTVLGDGAARDDLLNARAASQKTVERLRLDSRLGSADTPKPR